MKNIIIECLNETEVEFQCEDTDENTILFTTDLLIKQGNIEGLIILDKDEQQVVIYMQSPLTIPEKQRYAVSEFISRINYGDNFGAFVIDMNDGFMGYKNSFFYEETLTGCEMRFYKNFSIAYRSLEFYLPGILEVAYGGKLPTDAIAKLKHKVDPKLN